MDVDFFVGLLSLALVKSTPLVLGAMCGMLCERSGVINIGIEGMMLVGAMMAFVGSILFNNLTGGALPVIFSLIAGLLIAMFSAALIAALHAVLSIKYKIDQIISGTVINLLAVGITNFVTNAFIDPNPNIEGLGIFPHIRIPGLSQIPIIGPILFEHKPLVYVMLILVVVLQFAIFNTRWGLRTRAVGEHPRAADTVGINVLRVRYINVIMGGTLAGIGGAFLVLESVGRFQKLMTNGSGFIALAALIFGKWTSIGALAAALLFGFSEALGVRLQLGDVNHFNALFLLTGLGVLALGLLWGVQRIIRDAEDNRSWLAIIGTLALGIVLVATTALVSEDNLFEVLILLVGLGALIVGLKAIIGNLVIPEKDRSQLARLLAVASGVVLLAIAVRLVIVVIRVNIAVTDIPIQILGLLPFVLTLLILAGFVGRAVPPAAIGQPYEKQ